MPNKGEIKGREGNQGKKSPGFTLLEVMIAICIFAIALLGLAQLQIVAIRSNAFANKLTTAATLAQDRLEQLVALPYDNILNGSDVSRGYRRVWTVQDDTPGAGMKTVAVTVTCQDGHSVQFSTIVAQE